MSFASPLYFYEQLAGQSRGKIGFGNSMATSGKTSCSSSLVRPFLLPHDAQVQKICGLYHPFSLNTGPVVF